MIKHVVMWKLRDHAEGASKKDNAQKFRNMILALRDPIPEIAEMEFGIEMSPASDGYDVVLVSSFRTKADLERYQSHPEHQKVVPFIKNVTSARAAVDYEV